MPPSSPQDDASIRPPHPLAQRLIERLRDRAGSRVLDFSAGNGRNGAALERAGHTVVSVDDAAALGPDPLRTAGGSFAAIVSTHGLLHGTVSAVNERLIALARRLDAGGWLYATFGSVRDARFEKGRRIGRWAFAPADGDERGVAHAFFDRARLQALLDPQFVVEMLEENGVDDVAGSWAHRTPLAGAVHWTVIARRRPLVPRSHGRNGGLKPKQPQRR